MQSLTLESFETQNDETVSKKFHLTCCLLEEYFLQRTVAILQVFRTSSLCATGCNSQFSMIT